MKPLLSGNKPKRPNSSMSSACKTAFVFGKRVGASQTRLQVKRDDRPHKVEKMITDGGKEAERLWAIRENKL